MKLFLIGLIAVCTSYVGFAQKTDAVVINPAKQNEEQLLKNMYRYPGFVAGKAYFKNGGITESNFNYNYFTNRILFITPKGDTLELSQGENFDRVTIQSDTFCFYNKEFIQQLTHAPSYNLFLKTSLVYNGSEKKGAYGGYSATSASSSISEIYVNNGSGFNKLALDQNIIYTFNQFYYISGKYGKFYPATKKGFYGLFPKNEKQIKEFLENNKIDFTKKEDLEKLLSYVRSLVN